MRRPLSPTVRLGRAAPWARLVVAAAVLGAAVRLSALASAGPPPRYEMIVNPMNHADAVDRAFVAQAFLKKIRQWPDGATIQPVDLDQESELRRAWSLELLGRSVEAVKNYWEQMIFSGRDLPPPEMRSDDDVVDFVLRKPGAIGYVPVGTNLRGARVISVR